MEVSMMEHVHDVLNVLGKLSICVLVAGIALDIFNYCIKKIYPKFHPKTTWKSHGSILQALPGLILAMLIAYHVGMRFKDYEFPNMLIPILAIVVFIIWLKRREMFYRK